MKCPGNPITVPSTGESVLVPIADRAESSIGRGGPRCPRAPVAGALCVALVIGVHEVGEQLGPARTDPGCRLCMGLIGQIAQLLVGSSPYLNTLLSVNDTVVR